MDLLSLTRDELKGGLEGSGTEVSSGADLQLDLRAPGETFEQMTDLPAACGQNFERFALRPLD
jgi:hypothetical protein